MIIDEGEGIIEHTGDPGVAVDTDNEVVVDASTDDGASVPLDGLGSVAVEQKRGLRQAIKLKNRTIDSPI